MVELDELYLQPLSIFEKYYDAAKIWMINRFSPLIERPFWLQNKPVYVYGPSTASIGPFGMVYGSYPCSTVSWLQLDPLDLFWEPSIPKIWSFKKVVSSFLCIMILVWRHQGELSQNAFPAIPRPIPNIIRRPVCHMKAHKVYFHLIVLLGCIY